MDIWLIAVLVAWLPVACALALLVGHSVAEAERRKRLALPPEGVPVPLRGSSHDGARDEAAVSRAVELRLHRVS